MFNRNFAASFISNRVALIDATVRAGMSKAMTETEMNEQFRHIQAEITDALRNGAASPAAAQPGAVIDRKAIDVWYEDLPPVPADYDVPPLPAGFRFRTKDDGAVTRQVGSEWRDATSGSKFRPCDAPCLGRPHHTVAGE